MERPSETRVHERETSIEKLLGVSPRILSSFPEIDAVSLSHLDADHLIARWRVAYGEVIANSQIDGQLPGLAGQFLGAVESVGKWLKSQPSHEGLYIEHGLTPGGESVGVYRGDQRVCSAIMRFNPRVECDVLIPR